MTATTHFMSLPTIFELLQDSKQKGVSKDALVSNRFYFVYDQAADIKRIAIEIRNGAQSVVSWTLIPYTGTWYTQTGLKRTLSEVFHEKTFIFYALDAVGFFQ